MPNFKLTFFGVRGSYPVPGNHVAKYGGNTSCTLIETPDHIIILDAGTGIIAAGDYLTAKKKKNKVINIFLSHFHIDHTQGLPFFKPIYDPSYRINIHSYNYPENPLENAVYSLFTPPLSPIGKENIKAAVTLHFLDAKHPESIRLGEHAVIDYHGESHPVSGVLLFRVTVNGNRLVYATDVETPGGFSDETIKFIHGANVLIHDSMYFDEDYYNPAFSKKGFGHSTVSMAIKNAIKGEVKKIILFHYNPDYSDREVEKMLRQARKTFKNTYLSRELKGYTF